LRSSTESTSGGLREAPNSLVAEHRLQDLLADDGGAAGHADLGPGESGGRGEDDDHQRHPEPVHAVRQEASRCTPVAAFVTDQLEHSALPVPHGALDPRSQVARGATDVPGCVREQLRAGRQRLPRQRGPLGRRLGVLDDQRLQA
jgi:hypothetical protein